MRIISDEAQPIREGEELNELNLQGFLIEKLGVKTNEFAISQFQAGSSNLTYLLKLGTEEYVLRRPPFGNQVKSAHDMSREFNGLSKLSKVYQPAPKPLLYCEDKNIIGSQFYLMERRRGLIIRGNSPKELENSPKLQRKVCESFIENMVRLHALDYQKAGLGDLGKPEGYTHRQVEGWTKRYFNAKTDENAELETAIEWLTAKIPESNGAALIHNDYKFDNLMLDPNDLTKIVAVLDWEMTTVGDPLMDLGTTLGYWLSREAGEQMLSMPFNPRVLMENVSRRELVELYAKKSGCNTSEILFYHVFGTFKVAVIAHRFTFASSKATRRINDLLNLISSSTRSANSLYLPLRKKRSSCRRYKAYRDFRKN